MLTLLRPGLLLLLLTGAAYAQEPAPPAAVPPPAAAPATVEPASPRELQLYGEADASCREWGNGCQVCRRTDDHDWTCSSAGIACVPEAVTCRGR